MDNPYPINLDVFFSAPRCSQYIVWNIDGVLHYDVQGALQLACTGEPHLAKEVGDNEWEWLPGPVLELFTLDTFRMCQITDLHNEGKFDEASRAMLDFALEAGVVVIANDSLSLERNFEKVSKFYV